MSNIIRRARLLIAAVLCFMMVFSSCAPAGSTNQSVQGSPTVAAPTPTKAAENVSRTDEVFSLENHADKFALRFFYFEGKDSEKSGDSIFVCTPDGATMLIDSGTPESGPVILGYLQKMGIKKLDYVVATHLHVDHIGGFPAILNKIQADKVLMSSLNKYNTSTARNFLNTLDTKKIETQIVKRGDVFQLGREVKVEVLHPEEEIAIPPNVIPEDNAYVLNDQSVTLKMTYKNNTFLFTGDLYREGESNLIRNWGDKLDADLIKVPHHGAGTSSSRELVDIVKPEISVITHNMFASMEVYERYRKYGRVFVTGLDGTVLVTSDGEKLKVITEHDRKGSLK